MTGKAKKILEEIHPLQIIREVQRWPALFARDCPERASAHFRAKLWAEVARALFPDWEACSQHDRQLKLSDLIKKWRNLRDTFKRQVEIEKKIREGHKIKKKVYVYYSHMSFLLPHLQEETPTTAVGAAVGAAPAAQARARRLRRRYPPACTRTPAPVPALAPPDDIDEDRHFLMSLVPSFRRMTDDEKLIAKMDILKVIRDVRSAAPPASPADDVKQEIDIIDATFEEIQDEDSIRIRIQDDDH